MRNVLKSLSIGDIEFGKEYLLVEMWLNNSRHLKPMIIIEVDEENSCIIIRKPDEWIEHCHNFKDLGLIPEKSNTKWRVFKNTDKNRQTLKKLVGNSSALDYLLAIGFSEREALEIMRKNASDLEKKRETTR